MVKYCKAYQVKGLRAFAGWSAGEVEGLSDDDICYVWDDYSLRTSCFDESQKIFDEVTAEWKEFCTNTLHFKIPDDLQEADQESQSQE